LWKKGEDFFRLEPKDFKKPGFAQKLDQYTRAVKMTRTFFQDVIPNLPWVAKNHPDANYEKLFRGLLSTGLWVSKSVNPKLSKQGAFKVAELVADVWKLIAKMEKK
jgi:hypothetical protein